MCVNTAWRSRLSINVSRCHFNSTAETRGISSGGDAVLMEVSKSLTEFQCQVLKLPSPNPEVYLRKL